MDRRGQEWRSSRLRRQFVLLTSSRNRANPVSHEESYPDVRSKNCRSGLDSLSRLSCCHRKGILRMMRRTDLFDTSIEIHQLRIKLLREKSPAWRLQKAFELTDLSRSLFPEQTRKALLKELKKK